MIKKIILILLITCFDAFAQQDEAFTYLELNDKALAECLSTVKDTLACYDGYFRALDEAETDVYIAVDKLLSAEGKQKLEADEIKWKKAKYFFYAKSYTNFREKHPNGNFNDPSPEERKTLAAGYKQSALHARKRIIYLMSLVKK